MFRTEFVHQAFALALLGLTDLEMAKVFDCSEVTLNAWKKAHPDFFKSLKDGRAPADANVAKSLYQRAVGYSHKAVKIFNVEGAPLLVPYTEHYPPDTAACIIWLKNRRAWHAGDRPDTVINVNQSQSNSTATALIIPPEVYELAKTIAQKKFSSAAPPERTADDGRGAGEPVGLRPAKAA